jgi:pyrroloquinoline quinone biosynthesis protein B
MGHYAGLLQLGREAMGAQGMPVYVMPKMKAFLEMLSKSGNFEMRVFLDLPFCWQQVATD